MKRIQFDPAFKLGPQCLYDAPPQNWLGAMQSELDYSGDRYYKKEKKDRYPSPHTASFTDAFLLFRRAACVLLNIVHLQLDARKFTLSQVI